MGNFQSLVFGAEETGPDAPVKPDTSKPAAVAPAPAAAPAPSAPERPAGLPEKFKSVEDMVKSYAELEKKLSAGNPPAPAAAPGAPTAPAAGNPPAAGDAPAGSPAAAAAALTAEGIQTYVEEFAKSGALSEASYASLAAKGLPKDIVDSYISGQKAAADRALDNVMSAVGGKDTWAKVAKWAGENLPAAEIEAFNKIATGGDVEAAKLAAQGLRAKHVAAVGSPPAKILGGHLPTHANNVQPFSSQQEMIDAMRDPRYKSGDPAYHKVVEDRLMASN